jgi:hypothetical protein
MQSLKLLLHPFIHLTIRPPSFTLDVQKFVKLEYCVHPSFWSSKFSQTSTKFNLQHSKHFHAFYINLNLCFNKPLESITKWLRQPSLKVKRDFSMLINSYVVNIFQHSATNHQQKHGVPLCQRLLRYISHLVPRNVHRSKSYSIKLSTLIDT